MAHLALRPISTRRRPARRFKLSRRGMAILVVLLLLATTVVVSYSVLRSQSTMLSIQGNSDSRARARQAAIAGLTVALRKMHQPDWGGVGQQISGNLGEGERFKVSYVTGDPRLASDHPDYADLPFRVTLLATGMVDSPNQTSAVTHVARAVVRLVPRWLAASPAGWAEMNEYTVYQYADGDFNVDVPVRIQGNARAIGRLQLGDGYAWNATIRQRYLADLQQMRLNDWPDLRPFSGPLYLPLARQDATVVGLLRDDLGVTLVDTDADPLAGWSQAAPLTSYRLYPGGKLYEAGYCNPTLDAATLEPDPLTNPLGLFACSSGVQLNNNVRVKGTLVAPGAVDFYGHTIELEPADLPPLAGTSEPVQLPTVIAGDSLTVREDCNVVASGVLVSWDAFRARRGSSTARFDLEGKLFVKHLAVEEREPWDLTAAEWESHYTQFMAAQESGLPGNAPSAKVPPVVGGGRPHPLLPETTDEVVSEYFPVYLKTMAEMDPVGYIRIAPASSQSRFHWPADGGPVYAPHPDDPGLRWDLLEWKEELREAER